MNTNSYEFILYLTILNCKQSISCSIIQYHIAISLSFHIMVYLSSDIVPYHVISRYAMSYEIQLRHTLNSIRLYLLIL